MKINKTKIISNLKVLGLVAIGIAIGASSIITYWKGIEMYRFVTEIQAWEDSYFQQKDKVAQQELAPKPLVATTVPPVKAKESQEVKEGTISVAPSPTSNVDLVAKMGAEAFGESEAVALIELVRKESSFNHLAQNPESSAFGLYQFIDQTWKAYGCEKTTDPAKQTECGIKYIAKRYGTPSKALAYHQVNNSY